MPKNLEIDFEDYCTNCDVCDPEIETTELYFNNREIASHRLRCKYAHVCEVWAGKKGESL